MFIIHNFNEIAFDQLVYEISLIRKLLLVVSGNKLTNLTRENDENIRAGKMIRVVNSVMFELSS